MDIEMVCRECKKKFICDSNTVKARPIECLGDKRIINATTAKCTECGTEHVVQLDDDFSIGVLKELSDILKDKIILGRQGKKLETSKKAQFDDKRKLLVQYRLELMRKYDGKQFKEMYGKEFTLNCECSTTTERMCNKRRRGNKHGQ